MSEFMVDDSQLRSFLRRFNSRDGLQQIERKALEDLANHVLRELLVRTPFKTGYLRHKWLVDNPKIVVVPVEGGYQCELVNTCYYADWVENGHKAIPGQFVPPLKKRIKKTTTFVEGKFFVRSTAKTFNNGKANPIVAKYLVQWLERLINGK